MVEHSDAVPRDAAYWAKYVERLEVSDPTEPHGYNLQGRRVAGPMNGFGRLWQRTYTADLGTEVSPESLVADWRAHFGQYWPRMGRFHGSISAIEPGDVTALTAGGVTSGILVLYADDTSFTFLTPEGHMFAAMITFSAAMDATGRTIAQIRMLLRCSDPLFESMWPLARRGEDVFWPGVLRNLAAAHGLPDVAVGEHTVCVDRRRLWANWTNVRHNAGIRTLTHTLSAPFRPHRTRTSVR
ncbi:MULTISPECIES: hypothetical protein [Microbacterium]|uniref:hypothetical protein n=1 Tax=Microbacterium TaxID=33882 RepID=UPI0004B8752E|nr:MULTISPECIES: hypothetical protein [Microbacterium]